jgi:hypothetical protein
MVEPLTSTSPTAIAVFEIAVMATPTVGGTTGRAKVGGVVHVSRVVTMVTFVVRSGSLAFRRI